MPSYPGCTEQSRNLVHICLRSMFLLPHLVADSRSERPEDGKGVFLGSEAHLPLTRATQRPRGSQSSAHSSSPGGSGRSADPSPGDGVCPVFVSDPHRGGGQACAGDAALLAKGTVATTFLTSTARSLGHGQRATSVTET